MTVAVPIPGGEPAGRRRRAGANRSRIGRSSARPRQCQPARPPAATSSGVLGQRVRRCRLWLASTPACGKGCPSGRTRGAAQGHANLHTGRSSWLARSLNSRAGDSRTAAPSNPRNDCGPHDRGRGRTTENRNCLHECSCGWVGDAGRRPTGRQPLRPGPLRAASPVAVVICLSGDRLGTLSPKKRKGAPRDALLTAT